MEEVDSIILHFLRELNITIDDDIKNLSDLPVETIVDSVSKCLCSISPSLKPIKLPSGISQRIEVAAQLASICKDLGYKNDVGYQTFLYYNEAELRQVFMFLIERLPNEGKSVSTVVTNQKSQLHQNIAQKIAEDLNTVWIPPCCNSSNNKSIGDFKFETDIYPSASAVMNLTEEELVQKLQKMNVAATVGVSTQTGPAPNLEITEQSSATNENETKHEINKSLKDLKEMAIVLRHKLDQLESERNVMNAEYHQLNKACEKIGGELKNVQNILTSIGISGNDVDNISDNILEKVQKNINSLHRKSEELTSKNLSLKVDIDKIRTSMSSSQSERTKCKGILVDLKESARAMKEEFEKKEVLKEQLKTKIEKFRGGNKRSIYTKRILEIISNVDKQNMEIKKILDDTRHLQKEINTLEGQLDRCFSIADETLFKDAKKDDQAKKAYKLLALLHSECNTIVSLVNDTGTLSRDIVDLEDNIKTEKTKRTEDTLQKILVDLNRMKEECDSNEIIL